MTRPARIAVYAGAGLIGLLLLIVLAAVLILPSEWFENKVRDRIVFEIERSTGGRAEIGAFHFDWKALKATVGPVTLHGTEPAGAAPLLKAERIEVGLKIISLMKRDIDIASLHIEKPQVNFIVDENGITNFPKPKVERKSEKDPLETVLDLAVGNFTVAGGLIRYSDRQIPLDLRGENFDVHLGYDGTGPRYAGTLKFERLHFDSGETEPMQFAFESQVKLERNRLAIDSARLAMPTSNIAIAGEIADFKSPRAAFDVRAMGSLAELGPPLKLPPPHKGNVSFTGRATYTAAESYQLAGKVSGRNLAISQAGITIANVSLDSDLQLNKDQLLLRDVVLKALDGSFTGNAALTNNFKNVKLNGTLNGLSLGAIASAQGVRNMPWDGRVSGPVEVTTSLGKGAKDLRAAATLNIAPVSGDTPVEGKIEVAYDQRSGAVQLGRSYLSTPASRVNITGTLGQKLDVYLETRDLNDLMPALALAGTSAPKELPVRITPGGSAVFTGTIVGPTRDMQINGQLQAKSLVVQNQPVDSFTAQVQANRSRLQLASVAAGQGQMRLEGTADIALNNWKPVGGTPLTAKVRLQNASLAKLLADQGQNVPVDGTLFVEGDLSGTATDPNARIRIRVENLTAYGERFDRLTAQINYTGGGVEVIDGQVTLGTARLYLTGTYTHPPNDWKNGRLRFDVKSKGFQLAQFKRVDQLRPGTTGAIDIAAQGEANVRNAEVLLTTLTGTAALRKLVVDKKPIGDVVLNAKTEGQQLAFTAQGNLRGSEIRGAGNFQLSGDYPGRGELSFSPLTLSTIMDLASTQANNGKPAAFDGVIEGRVTFAGPARKPELMTARLELPTVQVVPVQRNRARNGRDLTFRNEGPVVVELDPNGVQVRNARFVGPQTNLTVAGTLNYKAKNPWDLRINGDLNLGILEDFNPDIVSSGSATVAATVRGTLETPQLTGRLGLKDASLYMADFPNGLDQVNGTVVFDRNRATIERLTAVTGGGNLTLGGFVGYGGGEMSYRLQARADGVRIRYPEGVSFSANAALNLTGTTSRGLLTGVVTVLRAGFNPRTDVGGLLAGASKPVQTPSTPNEMLRNLQLDVRVETIPNLQFQTSLTQDLQAEADLRVRGTAAKPTVLGRITVNQGEIQFFGNKYQINRGEIGFYNPVRIEPVLDMDLETRVRGITVNINFSGSINKLNVSYRSDPPLQSSEIIALLAVGRAPGETAGLAASQTVSQSNMLMTGTNTLLGQAIAAPVSSRLQRFFGVSKLKIDPQLQNLDAIPQARLTLEQQISKDITLTYITNLQNTNQQIVRLQWDLNRNWSVLAVREENGLFGIDFLYKKRFR